jgi:hypothetical protein
MKPKKEEKTCRCGFLRPFGSKRAELERLRPFGSKRAELERDSLGGNKDETKSPVGMMKKTTI